MDSALAGLLGLARRAGKAQLGEEAALEAALAHKARLILTAADLSPHALERLERAAETGNAMILPIALTKAELGPSVGWANCGVVAVTDIGLAAAAVEKLAQADPRPLYQQALERLKPKAEKTARRRREKLRRKRDAAKNKP